MQREIFKNTTLELGYVGTKGSRLLHPYDANQVPAGDNDGNGVPDRLDFIHAGSDSDARAALRPYGVFGNQNISILDHGGSSIYHSLQTQLVSRFGAGSQFQASYTFSRTIGDVSLTGGENGIGATTTSLREDPGLDRGLTLSHRKHIFNAGLVLVLPEFEDKSGFTKHVLGGWEVGTIAQAASGAALTVYTGAIPGLTNRVSGTGQTSNQRPNVVPGRALPRDRRAPGADPEPERVDAHGLPAGHVRQLGPRRLRRPELRPGGPGALQEHHDQPESEGPAPVRGLQRLQPRQLHGGQHQPEPDLRHPRHGRARGRRRRSSTSSRRAPSARPPGPATRGRRSSASSCSSENG